MIKHVERFARSYWACRTGLDGVWEPVGIIRSLRFALRQTWALA